MIFPHPSLAPALARLVDRLHRLPGIGPKMAQRLAYYVVRAPREEAQALAEAIASIKEEVTFCSNCQSITDRDHNPCNICMDPTRDASRLCIVQEPLDILALERTRAYRGRYHVLHGAINPLANVRPEDLRIRELLSRLADDDLQEIILATNPTVEGEATAMYLRQIIGPIVPRISRLARGLPSGGDLEYADDLTLTRAIEGRQDISGR